MLNTLWLGFFITAAVAALAQWLVARWEAAAPATGGGTIVVEPIDGTTDAVADATVTLRVVFPGDRPIELDATVIDGIVHVLAVREATAAAVPGGAPPLPGSQPTGSTTEP